MSFPQVGVFIGPGPDWPGPKTEFMEGGGPKTGPDRFGIDSSVEQQTE